MKRQFFLFILALNFVSFNPLHANKWRVNSTPGVDADFKLFKTAHDAASPGDTLLFEGSAFFYGEDDTLSKQLCLIGPGYFLDQNDVSNDNILPAKIKSIYLDSAAAGSIIMGLSLMHPYYGLMIDASNVVIERNYLKGTLGFCYNRAIENVIVSKNYMAEIATRWGSDREIYLTNGLITNNIILGKIIFNDLSTAHITNNCTDSHIYAYNSVIKNNVCSWLVSCSGSSYQYNVVFSDAPSGEGNISNVGFGDTYATDGASTDGAWQLLPNASAKGAGEGGIDCGVFGGNDPYILSGYPPFPFIYNVVIPTTGIDKITIQIEARSQR